MQGRVRVLSNRCTYGRSADREREGEGHLCCLAAHKLLQRHLTVPVDVGRGVKPSSLLQIGAGGFRQLLDGEASGVVLVGGEEALFIRHGFRLGLVHRLRGWLGCDHGTKGSGEGISCGLVLATVVKFSHHRFRRYGGIAGCTGERDA